ncbi:MAG TPA: FAD-dependent oxidoreductase [Candidatus Kapabacteria bacterium]|nr:FAD-dependent oxidoreductase [Candidatus Kapabacteria bacterium]
MAEQIKFVDLDWLDSNFPCMGACPVHTEAGRYVQLIEEGRFREAYHVARKPNPFASICGRVCAAPCESACRRGTIDQPVAIRALKRFVCERYGVESMIDLEKLKEVFGQTVKKNGIRVAIIGAGPAGLSCAHDLALLGYDATVFDAQSVAGGMLRLGIPEYRLPRELIRLEVNAILSLGVEMKLNMRLGTDFTIADLKKQGYQAIFIAIGSHKSRDLTIEGVEYDGVLRAVDFLLNVNLGYRVELGNKVVVIGGGNVAIDVARTAARQEKIEVGQVTEVNEALDVARSAVRFGAKEVHMVCLEDWNEMPASKDEIGEALEERIHFHPRKGPNKIIGKDGKVTGLETVDCLSVFDEQKRFRPTFAPHSEQILEADTVIMAIGQTSDLTWVHPEDGIEVTPRNTIKVDPTTLATTAPGIYAGGDVSFGPRNAIDAVANGKRAAQSIHQYITGGSKKDVEIAFHEREVEIIVADTHSHHRERGYESRPRVPIPCQHIDRRVGVSQVELGYTEEQARSEAERCLHCWENTIFNEHGEDTGSECILCGGCVDICPEFCIDLVALDRVAGDATVTSGVQEYYDIVIPGQTDTLTGSVMIKDEERCIRCGLCAKRCPVGCITMESYTVSENMPIR